MTTDRADIPWGREWSSATYHGFAGGRPAPPPRPAKGLAALREPRTATIVAGVLAALALGLALGFLSKPKLAASNLTAAPMRAVTPAAGGLDVEVNAPTPPKAVKPAGKLEVLSPEMARNAERAAQTSAAIVSAAPRYAPVPTMAAPRPMPARLPDIAPPAPIVAPQPFAAGDPACAGARGRAAQLVCADPDLAAADRELNRAYRRAMRSVASPDQLRAEQRDWLAIREDAARHSPRAVANVYEQRIDELNQIADEGPG